MWPHSWSHSIPQSAEPMRALASRTCGEATWVYRSVVVTRAQDLLDDADVDALLDEERRRRMPGVVETSVADAGLLEDFFPLAPVFGAADRTAVVLAEDQVVILPVVGHGPFEELLLLVSSEQGQQLSGALEGELGLALALPERGASLQPAPQVWRGHRCVRVRQSCGQSFLCRCFLQFFGQRGRCHFSPHLWGSSQPCRHFARWIWNHALMTPVSRST